MEVEQELVSVVIPCYNHADFIEETVESILKSDYKNLEIIIVNDGSKDDSQQVIESIAAKFPQVNHVFQNNAGPSVARNNGIQQANGKYILPLDADDLISSIYISEAVAAFQKNKQVKVVYCEAEKFGEKQGRWNLKPFSLYQLARDNMIFVSAVFKKSDWEACGGYSEDIIWGWEDWEFWIKMLKNGGLVVKLPFVGFFYRIRSVSRRKSMDKTKKNEMIKYINSKHKDFIYSQLDGPLHIQRTHSKTYNRLLRVFGLLRS